MDYVKTKALGRRITKSPKVRHGWIYKDLVKYSVVYIDKPALKKHVILTSKV